MILNKTESALVKLFRWIKNSLIISLIKLSSKQVKLGSNCTFHSSKSVKTTDGGQITIGKNCYIDKDALIYAQHGEIIIGNDVYIGRGTIIVCKEHVSIGEDTLIAAYCMIRDTNHGSKKNQLIRLQQDDIDPVSIGSDCWLGSHVSVNAGATIHNGAIIGTHAVVIGSIKANHIAVGIPAKCIKERD